MRASSKRCTTALKCLHNYTYRDVTLEFVLVLASETAGFALMGGQLIHPIFRLGGRLYFVDSVLFDEVLHEKRVIVEQVGADAALDDIRG